MRKQPWAPSRFSVGLLTGIETATHRRRAIPPRTRPIPLGIGTASCRDPHPEPACRLRSEFEVEAEIDGEILNVLSGPAAAVREPPDAIDAQQAEDVFHAESHLHVGMTDGAHAGRKEQESPRVGQAAVVAVGQGAVNAFEDQHFAPVELPDERDFPSRKPLKWCS